ncbi:MAG: ComEC/Rec2 family competence protein, partial [Verrucomicrobia bacterium]|nr:ComEC/Rec2 family competence protein [Verrucomicrobiota bacterium]
TLSTGMSSSAVRGCLMALLCFLGPLVGRKPDIPSAMALAALIILAVDPFHLFDYGFLLSFVAVSGLIVLCPPMLRRVAPALEPDPFRLQPEPKPVHWSRRAFRAVAFLFVTSLAAWLVTTPLVARWFNLVSPVALLANLVVIPITTLVLLAGCLAILFGWAVPVLGEIFNFTNVALVSFLLWITDLMARIPYGHVFVRSPPLWSLAVWYGTLAMWVGWRQRAWCWIIAPVLLALSLGAGFLGSRNAVVLDVINWGDGPVCFVNGIGGDDLLINPGSRYHVRKVIRHLRRQGVDGLKAVVLAGAGSSRAGGTPDILQTMAVGELWIPSSAGRSVTLREAREAAREQGVAIRNMTNGATIRLRGGTTWSFLFTPADSSAALTGKPLLAWRLQRGARSVLCADNVSSPMTAGMSALARSLIPTVLIENRMDPDPARSSRAAWPAAINSEWRIICTRLLLQDEPPGTPASSHIIRLAPGQGVRIHLKDTIVRVEQF